jgi:preprotein translocase subunit SecB
MNQAQTSSQLKIHKLYIKEASFEIPDSSNSFRQEWSPELNVELHTQTKALAEKNTHDVVLTVKCTVSNQQKPAFIVEVQQAGIFEIIATNEAELHQTLGTLCPNLLYPYLREVVSNLVLKGGFPQLSLAPINFELIYQQQLAQQQNAKKDA